MSEKKITVIVCDVCDNQLKKGYISNLTEGMDYCLKCFLKHFPREEISEIVYSKGVDNG